MFAESPLAEAVPMSSPMFHDDRDNPYAPPKAEVGWHLARHDIGALVPFTVGAILSHSWSVFTERMGLCLGVFWASAAMIYGFFGLWVVLIMMAGMLAQQNDAMGILLGLAALAGYVGAMVFALWLSLGMTIVMLKLARGQAATFADLFSGGRYILTTLGAGFLAVLAVYGVVIVGMLPVGLVALAFRQDPRAAQIIVILGMVCGVGASLALATRLVPLAFVIVDRDPGVLGAFGQTVRLTAGREWRIIALVFLGTAIYMGGFLACGVGVIFTLPFAVLMLAVMYVAMAGEAPAPSSGADDVLPESKPVSGFDPDFDGLS